MGKTIANFVFGKTELHSPALENGIDSNRYDFGTVNGRSVQNPPFSMFFGSNGNFDSHHLLFSMSGCFSFICKGLLASRIFQWLRKKVILL